MYYAIFCPTLKKDFNNNNNNNNNNNDNNNNNNNNKIEQTAPPLPIFVKVVEIIQKIKFSSVLLHGLSF